MISFHIHDHASDNMVTGPMSCSYMMARTALLNAAMGSHIRDRVSVDMVAGHMSCSYMMWRTAAATGSQTQRRTSTALRLQQPPWSSAWQRRRPAKQLPGQPPVVLSPLEVRVQGFAVPHICTPLVSM